MRRRSSVIVAVLSAAAACRSLSTTDRPVERCPGQSDGGLLGASCEPDGSIDQCACGLSCVPWGTGGLCSTTGCDAGSNCNSTGLCVGTSDASWCTPTCDPTDAGSCGRPDYFCAPVDTGDGGLCQPDCRQQPQDFCALESGEYWVYCDGYDGGLGGSCVQSECTGDQTCAGDICVPVSPTGLYVSWVCLPDCRTPGNGCPPGSFCDSAVGACGPSQAVSGMLGAYCDLDGGFQCDSELTCLDWGGAGICTKTGCAQASLCGQTDGIENPCVVTPDGGSFCTTGCQPELDSIGRSGCGQPDLVCGRIPGPAGARLGCQPNCWIRSSNCDAGPVPACQGPEADQFCDSLSGYGSSCQFDVCVSVPVFADGGCYSGAVPYDPPHGVPSCVSDCRVVTGVCPSDRSCDESTGLCDLPDGGQ